MGLAATMAAFQRRSPHKLRATALLEITRAPNGKVATLLTPITILDNGRFEDASIYKSHPQPLALESGVVYEAQRTGIPVGYVTINNGEVKGGIWVAEGSWQPVTQTADKAPPSNTQPATPSRQNAGTGDDRPILHRGGSSSGNDSSQPAPQPAQTSAPPRPAPEPEPEPDDPNRPVLRRRKPAAQPSPETTSTPTPGATPPARSSQPAPHPVPVLNASGTPQMFVAVSDAQSSESRSYEYNWRPQEKEQIEDKVRKLALDQLPGVQGQVNQPMLTHVVIRSFDVDLSNDAIVVLTAEVPGGYLATGPTPKPTPHITPKKRTTTRSRQTTEPAADENPQVGKFVSRYIALITRIDLDGNPRKLAASVTDSSRLDVAPRLELIDAVDVDGDGLAELLFREYSFDQKGFIIYGIGHGTVTKVFEGASQPLR